MSESREEGLSGTVVLVLAVVCGCAVANTYFPQSLTTLIARSLHVPRSEAALVVTSVQLGYAAGIFTLVPLGDRIAHRRLTVTLLLCTAAGLYVAGVAHSLALLAAASAEIGLTTVVAQVILPMAAELVPSARRGKTAGQLMTGIICGILLARAFGGLLGAWLGWRAPYFTAGTVALAGAIVLKVAMPDTRPSTNERYLRLLRASLELFRSQPALRRSCAYQGLMFGAFIATWTSVALLITGRVYHDSTEAVGLLAIVGAGSALAAPVAGRWLDRSGPDPVNAACFVGCVVASGILLIGAHGGTAGWVALGAGMLVLDTSVQCSSTASQFRVLGLIPGKRSRLNTAYMTCTFLGGALGSWLGVEVYDSLGWTGVCGLVASAGVLALSRYVVFVVHTQAADTDTPAPATEAADVLR